MAPKSHSPRQQAQITLVPKAKYEEKQAEKDYKMEFGEKQKNPQPKGWDFTSQDISQVMSTDYKSFS